MKFNFESWQEFLDWNVKRENHIKELEQHNYELEMENRKLENGREISSEQLNQYVDTISNLESIIDVAKQRFEDTQKKNYGGDESALVDDLENCLYAMSEKYRKLKNATAENSDE